jgi:glutathione peroxidase
MKKTIYFLLALSVFSFSCKKETSTPVTEPTVTESYDSTSIYFYSFTDLDGKEVKLSSLKGKKIMFVNVASFCGNTPQYAALQKLYDKYKEKMTIIGFPCNDFGGQEPGGKDDIEQICSGYNVTFPIADKIEILKNTHPIYQWLTKKSLNGKFSSTVDWNFQKYLVNADGTLAAKFENYTEPDDPSIIAEIEK